MLSDREEIKQLYDCKLHAFGSFVTEYDFCAVSYPLDVIRGIVDLDVADKFYNLADPFICGFQVNIKRISPHSAQDL